MPLTLPYHRPDIDWDAVIEAACVKTVRAIRESTPPILLDDIAEEGTAGLFQNQVPLL